MCTELVPVLHTRENFVPDLHMCDEFLTNSSHVRSYLLEKFEHKSHLQFIEIGKCDVLVSFLLMGEKLRMCDIYGSTDH